LAEIGWDWLVGSWLVCGLANELEANELVANELGANELEANELEANELEANELGATRPLAACCPSGS
jgi:hypothetical protein